ncbi:MAG TPA: DNA-directed RNA polymerase subunit beta' [Firmicutes bacterium]|nr:DNA-directed RNA polymerase subunit beta' [Bacillota bacterium]
MYELNDFNSIQISIASPEKIREWSYGEVTKPETINYRTQKPERDGLFCEKIFGPTKDWECHCGKYKRIRYKGIVCEKCGVEVTRAKVRRERMGHIELAAPVSHIWYFRGVPSKIGLLLDMGPKALEQVIYFAAYTVLDAGFLNKITVLLHDGAFDAFGGKDYAAIVGLGEVKEVRVFSGDDARAEAKAAYAEALKGELAAEEALLTAARELNDLNDVSPTAAKTADEMKALLNKMNGGAVAELWTLKERSSESGKSYVLLKRRAKLMKSCSVSDPETKAQIMELENESITYKQVVNDRKVRELEEVIGEPSVTGLKVGMGAEAIRELLMAVDLEKESALAKEIIDSNATGPKRVKAIKRIEIIEAFRKSGNKPEWMILTVLPVIPPDLRPMVQLDGGRFASSDLNDLYRRVINRNNRLKRMIELSAPEMIVKNEKRMLQEAVDALIDNGRRGKPLSGPSNRELKSLSGLLRGKQGRFRQNLLGKRVDYSGRSVIVVGPELKIYQCGLPKEMAIELFKPFVMKRLVETGKCHNIKSAKRTVEKGKDFVWDVLEEVIKEHPVLLNRAPTLHRLSIQAFEPILIEGRAIKISPLVCGPFNADFDGDQMAVHLPLSIEAQAEARFLMLSANNILKLADGKSVMSPTQDMIIGAYYLTILRREEGKKYDEQGRPDENGEEYIPPVYASFDEALMSYQLKDVHCEDEIYVRRTVELPEGKFDSLELPYERTFDRDAIVPNNGLRGHVFVTRNEETGRMTVTGTLKTTVGRIIYNDNMPQDLGFVKRENPEDYLKLELSTEFIGGAKAIGKKHLSRIVEACFKTGYAPKAAAVLDAIKERGYKYSTIAALTTSVFDMKIPEQKDEIVERAEEQVAGIAKKYARGLLRDEERYNAVIKVWDDATDEVAKLLKEQGAADKFNPIWMMADSGARGSIDQIKQLSGMRGLMVNPQGKKIEVPVKSCFRNGLSVLEYFISSHGGRKGLADTALKTADSGYLTRRLVDVSQDVIVREEDCCAGRKPRPTFVKAITNASGDVIESLEDRLTGRFAAEDILSDDGEVLVKCNEMIGEGMAKRVASLKRYEESGVPIRSIFNCTTRYGVCAKCYGKDMATTLPIKVGEAVGVIAAQSIGEPGTQLTMRTFHTGGIAATGDITQGLPRVEELFEARKPKGVATICEFKGVASVDDKDNNLKHVVITDEATGERLKDYELPFNAELLVKSGDHVVPGTQLNAGSVNPQDIIRVEGVKGVQDYILHEVQSVYRSQGVDINDKHVEIIVRQMIRKVRVENAGTTDLLPGQFVDMFTFEEQNEKTIQAGGIPATAKRVLLGITKAALATDSFLSAASFQETSRVLTEAAICTKRDPLIGLKENVIIGKLIPAGTGMKDYKNVSVQSTGGYRDMFASASDETTSG